MGTAADVLDLAGPMLGRDGPRRWFLAVVTPGRKSGQRRSGRQHGRDRRRRREPEARSRSSASPSSLERSTTPLPPGCCPSIYAEAYDGWNVPDKLQNVTVVADFPTAAEALEAVMPLAGRGAGRRRPSASTRSPSRPCSTSVGPVRVPSWPVPITAGNAALGAPPRAVRRPRGGGGPGEVPRPRSSAPCGNGPLPATSLQLLWPRRWVGAVRGRHIQLHSRRTEEQAALGRFGADGAPPRSGTDHLGLVTDNASQSKIDWFLRRAVDYHLRFNPGSGSAEATVKVTLTNDAPAIGAARLRARRCRGRPRGKPPDRAGLHAFRPRVRHGRWTATARCASLAGSRRELGTRTRRDDPAEVGSHDRTPPGWSPGRSATGSGRST